MFGVMKSSEGCYVAGMEGVRLGILEVIFGLSESDVIFGLVFFLQRREI